jgi:hypothetical protein
VTIPDWQRRALAILERGNLNPVHEAWLIGMRHRTKVPNRQHFAYLSAVEMGIAGAICHHWPAPRLVAGIENGG